MLSLQTLEKLVLVESSRDTGLFGDRAPPYIINTAPNTGAIALGIGKNALALIEKAAANMIASPTMPALEPRSMPDWFCFAGPS